MTGSPRLLVVMGSGETSPTMAKIHRQLFDCLGSSSVPAVVLDSPVGFQENADDVSARAVAYFRESVGRPVTVASFRSATEIGTVEHETMLNRLREARWVFSGPGSPSYALEQWRPSLVPAILAGKLRSGGCLTFASAAAVTLGPLALPVYEIYKVGQAPHWIEGLDLTAEAGLPAVVIPHFDNAEGGTHDTRYCYMGERRLTRLEALLPEDVFVLGVDEHTACILDLEASTASVAGRGAVTVRKHGRSHRVVAGETVSIAHLRDMATLAGGSPPPPVTGPTPDPLTPGHASPLLTEVARLQLAFEEALSGGDRPAAVNAILALEQLLLDWSRDTLQSDEGDRGRAALRSMVTRLGEAADVGARDLPSVVGPLVEPLLEVRARARAEGRWADADAIRDRLVAAGVEVHDTADGTTWELRAGRPTMPLLS